ncbi:DUF2852 domain-containing protein [uncultured Planktomarina sp.]
MDHTGKDAWIATIILGFIFFWPLVSPMCFI